jgi:BirA family biotin operon repressor/biotin-[acetyl-CoA-carboxylase] ligase
MRQVGRKEFVLPAVFTELIENLETRYIQLCESKWNALKDEYTESLFGINEVREFESEKKFSGAIKGIDNRGLLIIESEGKSEKFSLNRIKYIFRTA